MSDRAVPHVRKFLGQRLRELRKQGGLSQERLGKRSSLSGKFIGEVERGEKSISIDILYRVSVALKVPLRHLTDVRPGRRAVGPGEDAERIFALVSGRHRPVDMRREVSAGSPIEPRPPPVPPHRRPPSEPETPTPAEDTILP
jgi:transcriptional regulator with XRE-family HTH domain